MLTSVAVTGMHLPARIRIGTPAQRQVSTVEPDRDVSLHRRARVDSVDLVVALVLAADRVLGRQRAQRAYQP